ncbi:MAG TPA: rhodanese-related sulfurtransferase, partial [Candidatus Saccharimonadales bacterium]|nr:rhodanese-related sulfurtransferase [Candidatus Saccharimonadales bacterium]
QFPCRLSDMSVVLAQRYDNLFWIYPHAHPPVLSVREGGQYVVLQYAHTDITGVVCYTTEMQKILLYYLFTPLSDPEAIRLWQKALGERLHLRGRILISQHGLNGTVGGDMEDLKAYVKETKSYAPFKKMTFKWSEGGRDDFPKLSIKVRDEIVTFGAPGELKVDENGVVGGGKHLKPHEVHRMLEERGDEVVFFDGRNAYEAAVGRFKQAVVLNARTTRDFLDELSGDKYNNIKDRPVVTYCTGGIRCEVLSVLMKNRGFKEVYQIDGGIVKYGEAYGDEGLWEGSLYVFDNRKGIKFTEKAKDIGVCAHCKSKTSNYENCAIKSCNNLVLICENCRTNREVCSDACQKKYARPAIAD